MIYFISDIIICISLFFHVNYYFILFLLINIKSLSFLPFLISHIFNILCSRKMIFIFVNIQFCKPIHTFSLKHNLHFIPLSFPFDNFLAKNLFAYGNKIIFSNSSYLFISQIKVMFFNKYCPLIYQSICFFVLINFMIQSRI